jgi:quercetin dioxygenase-like cupin family protein
MTGRPGKPVPYVARLGDMERFLVAGQVVHVLATEAETSGTMGIVYCQAPRDKFPVPLHWHAREHDTWYCTRGTIRVWGNGAGRELHPGDFAYVPPTQVHAYQCTGTANAFFGLIAPGGWEAFFGDAGTAWHEAGVPLAGSQPFDLPRMMAAQAKHGVMRVEQSYPPITEGADDALPGSPASYFLKAGHGERRALFGALFTRIVGGAQNGGAFSMDVVEAPRDATLPARRQKATQEAMHVLAGLIRVTIDGNAHELTAGDTAILSPGTLQETQVLSGSAQWLSCLAGGDAGQFVETAGTLADGYSYPLHTAPVDMAALRAMSARYDVDFA